MNYQPKNARLLKKDAVPTLKLPGKTAEKSCSARAVRMAKKRHDEYINDILMVNAQASTTRNELHKSHTQTEHITYCEKTQNEEVSCTTPDECEPM